MSRKRAYRNPTGVALRSYSFRLSSKNVERVRGKVHNLSGWVDEQFRLEAQILDWTQEQKMVWKEWLAAQPEAVRAVAARILPSRRYVRRDDPSGEMYAVRSYDIDHSGVVTLTCDTGDRRVYLINPEDLQEA